MRRFAVAVWCWRLSPWPEYFGCVEAVSAFAAIEALMVHYGRRFAWAATARAADGSLIYRAYRVRLRVAVEGANTVGADGLWASARCVCVDERVQCRCSQEGKREKSLV